MRFRVLVLLIFVLAGRNAHALGYQANINLGLEQPNRGEGRKSATFLQGGLATLTKVFRLQTTFTALTGSAFLEAEGAVGLAIYPVSQLVSERAPIHPFLMAMGTAAIGTLNQESRMNTGAVYGAGMDLKWSSRSGITLALQQHAAKEKSLRYIFGFFWQRGD